MHYIRGTWCQYVPLLVMLTLITARFLHCSYYFSLCNEEVSCGEILWDFVNILFHVIFQPSPFCIHQWSISVICGKWPFSILITPFSFNDWNSAVRKSSSFSLASLFVQLCIYFIFISIWTCGYLFYSVGHNLLPLFIFLQNVPDLVIGSSIKLVPASIPNYIVLICEGGKIH